MKDKQSNLIRNQSMIFFSDEIDENKINGNLITLIQGEIEAP